MAINYVFFLRKFLEKNVIQLCLAHKNRIKTKNAFSDRKGEVQQKYANKKLKIKSQIDRVPL